MSTRRISKSPVEARVFRITSPMSSPRLALVSGILITTSSGAPNSWMDAFSKAVPDRVERMASIGAACW